LQNAAQQVDHENRMNKWPVKCIVNYLDHCSQEEYGELSSHRIELNITKAQTKTPFKCPTDLQVPNISSMP